MKKHLHKLILFSATACLSACTAQEPLTDYVDPRIGTAHSRWFFFTPAAVPFGMAKLAPTTDGHLGNPNGWEAVGYDSRHTSIEGFANFHEFQVGGVVVAPTVGELQTVPGPLDNPDAVLRAIEVLTAEWGFGWSPTRITLSTAGVTPQLRRLLDTTRVHLAVSLHNPFAEERAAIMPIERAYPIRELVDVLRDYDFTGQRRVSFEYILMQGLNDSPRHLRELCRLLNGLRCRINLIRFHRIPDSPYFSPDRAAMERFRDTLTARGITTTIRASRGEDIQAACGLLSTRGLEGEKW